jgi:hypothetical protein
MLSYVSARSDLGITSLCKVYPSPLPSRKAGVYPRTGRQFRSHSPQLRFVFVSAVSLVWSASPPSEVQTLPDPDSVHFC